jgi:succinylarginine dihydrolase
MSLLPKPEVKLHANALLLQISHQKLWTAVNHTITNTSCAAIQRVTVAKLIRLTQTNLVLCHPVTQAVLLAIFNPGGKFRNFWIFLHVVLPAVYIYI